MGSLAYGYMDNSEKEGSVLFVGDSIAEDSVRDLTEYPIAVESTVSAAVERIRQTDVCCIVSEYQLQNADGVELIETVRVEYPDLPIILWTAAGDEVVASDAITAGVTDYLIRDEAAAITEQELDRLEVRIDTLLEEQQSDSRGKRSGENGHKFQAVFEEAFDAMLIANDNAAYVDANPAACELFGLSREELLGRSIDEFAAEDYNFETAWREFQESDRDRGIFPLVRPDGEKRIVEFAATPNIRPGRHLSVLRDVTEQRRMENELNEIFECITDAVHGLDDEWRFTHVNNRAEELLGRTEGELRGKYVWDEFPDALERSYREHYERAMETQKLVVFEEYSDAAGTWLEVHAYPSETGLSVYFHDISERKQRERELEQYETIVETVTDGICILNRDSEFVKVNDAFVELTGYSRGELLGAHASLVRPASMDDVFDDIQASLDAGSPIESVGMEIETDDGNTRAIDARYARFAHGDDSGRIGVWRDITHRKEYERKLELFRNLADHSSDGINIIDPETAEIIEANDASCRMLGYERSELLSLAVPDINPEFSMDMWDQFVEAVKEDGTKIVESTHQRKDGSTFPVEVKITRASLDADYHVAAVRDITERKKRERELEASEERFRSLIETAPDPIFVADTETGEIVETNTAACTIRHQSRDEILGLQQTALHPEEEADRYEELFERHIEQGGTINHFPDGSPVLLTTADGERIPVAISARTVHLGNRTLVHGIFRDISEQKRYEESLEELNRAAQDFLTAETDHEIVQTTVDIASDILDLPGVAVYLYDEDDGVLKPAAYSTASEDLLGEIPVFSPGDSIAWRVYTTQEQAVFDDVRSDDDVYNPGSPIRSELVIPLGKYGVFLAGDTEIDAFDDLTVDLAEVLATTAETALDRIDRVQQLHEQERESQLHAQRLEHVNLLNEKIRSIIQAIVHAETSHEIEQAVCDALTEIDRFKFAWIGTPDFVASELTPSSWAGTTREYLESISLHLDPERREPSLTAARQRETTVVSNIAESLQQESWRQDALMEDYRSAISVPLLHEQVLYGVLTIYGYQPSTFDELSRTVLADLGELIGYALNAVEQRKASRSKSVTKLALELPEAEDLITTLASRGATDLDIRNISTRSDGSYVVHLLAHDVNPDRFMEGARGFTSLDEVRSIGDPGTGLFELIISESCIVTDMVESAGTLHSITLSEQGSQMSVSIPSDRDVRAFIERLRDQYPELTLVGRHDTEQETSLLEPSSLLDQLTTRQQEILKTAYYSGFFDQPRKRTGSEISDSLGISQPAFSKQLRKGERKLVKSLYDPESQFDG